MKSMINYVKHAVAGSSKLKATTAGHIYSVRVGSKDLDNGTVIGLGVYESPEVYKEAAAPTTFEAVVEDVAANGNYYVRVTKPEGALLVLTVPMNYENYTTKMAHESYFYNEAGEIARAYELYKNDVFELSAEGFTGEFAKGDTVVVDAVSKKLKKKAG